MLSKINACAADAWILEKVSALSSRVADKSYFVATADVVFDSAAGYELQQSAKRTVS